MNKNQGIGKLFGVVLVVGGFLCWGAGFAFPQTPKGFADWKPKSLTLLVQSVGGTGHATGTAVASAITDATGVKVAPIPSSKALERTELLRSKKANIFMDNSASTTQRWYGTLELNRDEFGPQKIRALWVCGPQTAGYLTQKDSGIKKVADIKGKRITECPGYDSFNQYLWALVAFANLTLKDVEITKFPNYAGAGKSISQRKADVTWQTTTAAGSYEAASSPGGIYWIPLPPEDKAGWARLQKVCPFFFPAKAKSGAGISAENPVDIMRYTFVFTSYPWLNEKMAYWFTKEMHLLYDQYKGKHKYLASWTIDECLNVGAGVIPFHPGSIVYFKEIGRWTPELEKWQQERLAQEKQRIADWKGEHPKWKSIPE
jgi:TRAP transporter TAXI family solute receptor